MASKQVLNIIEDAPDRVMAIGAHPDDVEFGAGATLAKWRELGAVVTVVVCTDGGAGGTNRGLDPEAVAKRRRGEQQAAARDLGVHHLVMLGNADGGLEDTGDFRGTLVELIRYHRPDVILTHDPHLHSRFTHRDHRVTGQVSLDAVYPFARDHLHYPDQIARGLAVHRVDRCLLWDTDAANAIVDISTTLAMKTQALRRHASQLGGILGDKDLDQWLRQQHRDAASGFDFASGEVFRLLQAPP